MVQLTIQSSGNVYLPSLLEGAALELSRAGTPGKLTFSLIKDEVISFQEGDRAKLFLDGAGVFSGFVFAKKRTSDGIIKVTAYDQLRYLKNKDTYQRQNITATQIIRAIAADFQLQTGALAETGWAMEELEADNKTLFDIIQTALDETLRNTGRLYVLYDDFGKLALRDVADMKLDLLLDESAGEDFDYTSSIDGETYNQIKLAYDNKDAGKREIYLSKDSAAIAQWGVLQYFEKIDQTTSAPAKADALLKLYNHNTRELTVKGAFGDPRVRAGSSLPVSLNLGDLITKNYMVVERVKHRFDLDRHTMDLNLRGGDFIA